MKKILYFLSLIVSITLFTISCEIDNYPMPDATFYGALRDVVGGGLVEQEIQNGSRIGVYEHGYETPQLQNWSMMHSGEFRNNLVFAGTYDVIFQSCNFFPFEVAAPCPDVIGAESSLRGIFWDSAVSRGHENGWCPLWSGIRGTI